MVFDKCIKEVVELFSCLYIQWPQPRQKAHGYRHTIGHTDVALELLDGAGQLGECIGLLCGGKPFAICPRIDFFVDFNDLPVPLCDDLGRRDGNGSLYLFPVLSLYPAAYCLPGGTYLVGNLFLCIISIKI